MLKNKPKLQINLLNPFLEVLLSQAKMKFPSSLQFKLVSMLQSQIQHQDRVLLTLMKRMLELRGLREPGKKKISYLEVFQLPNIKSLQQLRSIRGARGNLECLEQMATTFTTSRAPMSRMTLPQHLSVNLILLAFKWAVPSLT